MGIIKHKGIFIGISAVLVLTSLILIFTLGLPVGIEFKGGALTEISYPAGRPDISQVNEAMSSLSLGNFLVQPRGEDGYFIKTRDLTEPERVALFEALSLGGTTEVISESFTSIGPSVGNELKRKAITAIIITSIAIIFFIAYAFRKVTNVAEGRTLGVKRLPNSWTYGLVAIITLLHDVTLATGAFVLFGHFLGAEADGLFVVALLTILGLSVNDTIVIFDRIRENIAKERAATFPEIVGHSIKETINRSLITALSVIVVLVALVIWGPQSTKIFAATLGVGMFFGSYSSIFLASPLLVLIAGKEK